jgi:hypothetical protein
VTDLFDRVAAQALGLGLTLRPRARNRFESGSEFPEWEMPDSPAADEESSSYTSWPTSPRGAEAAPPVVPATDAANHVRRSPLRNPAPTRFDALPLNGPRAQQSPPNPTDPPDVPAALNSGLIRSNPDAPRRADGISADPSASFEPGDTPLTPDAVHTARTIVPSGARSAHPADTDPPQRQTPATSPLPRPSTRPADMRPIASLASDISPSPLDTPPLAAPTVDARVRRLEPPVETQSAEAPGRQPLPAPWTPGRAGRSPDNQGHARTDPARVQPKAPPAIEITIGRLEIRAEPGAASRPAKPFEPHVDLATYRTRRERGQ